MNIKLLSILAILTVASTAYAEMKTTVINGYTVNYYTPDSKNAQIPKDIPLNLKVMIHDPSPLPENYRPVLAKTKLTTIKATSTQFEIEYITEGNADLWGEECYTFPENAKTAFAAATAIWAQDINTSVPITIQACWGNFAGSTLGYSGSLSVVNFSNAPITNTYYSLSLANSFAKTDVSTSYKDMYITLNDAFAWYFGTDGNTPSDKTDLLTVSLHEIAHALNFSGGMSYSSGTGSYDTYPNVYDRLISDGSGNPIINLTNNSTDLGDALTSNNLYFTGAKAVAANEGNVIKIYAPASWQEGSSYSHLDYDTFNNTKNQLMVYSLSRGEAIHAPGNLTLGMLADMGWETTANMPTPKNINPSIIMYLLN